MIGKGASDIPLGKDGYLSERIVLRTRDAKAALVTVRGLPVDAAWVRRGAEILARVRVPGLVEPMDLGGTRRVAQDLLVGALRHALAAQHDLFRALARASTFERRAQVRRVVEDAVAPLRAFLAAVHWIDVIDVASKPVRHLEVGLQVPEDSPSLLRLDLDVEDDGLDAIRAGVLEYKAYDRDDQKAGRDAVDGRLAALLVRPSLVHLRELLARDPGDRERCMAVAVALRVGCPGEFVRDIETLLGDLPVTEFGRVRHRVDETRAYLRARR